MQIMHMYNRGSTYTEYHWMRDFIKNLLCLAHGQWLGWNLMKYHRIKGVIAIKTKEDIVRELDIPLDKDIHNTAEKDRLMLDLDPSDKTVMSMGEMSYMVFEI